MSRGASDVLVIVYAVGMLIAASMVLEASFPSLLHVTAFSVPRKVIGAGGVLAFAVLAWRFHIHIKARRAAPVATNPDMKHD